MNFSRLTAIAPVVLVLSACSGSKPPTYAGYELEYARIVERLLSQGVNDYTPNANIPAAGSATYRGVVGFDASDGSGIRESYAGRMRIDADFDAAPGDVFSGSVSDVVNSSEDEVSGSLDVIYGDIDRTADTLTEYQSIIDLRGNLVESGVTLSVDATADGDFYGDGAEALAGDIDGTMSSGAYGTETVTGIYITER